MTTRQAYKALPKLRESLKRFKRETVAHLRREIRSLSERAQREPSRVVTYTLALRERRLAEVRAAAPHTLRGPYMAVAIQDVREAPLWHLSQALGERFRRL